MLFNHLPLPPITASTSPSVSTPAMKKNTAMLHSVVSDDEARRTRGVRGGGLGFSRGRAGRGSLSKGAYERAPIFSYESTN